MSPNEFGAAQDLRCRTRNDEAFHQAFRRFFLDVDLHLKRAKDWDALFDGMDNGGNATVVRRTEDGRIIGFAQYFQYDVESSYLTFICGLVHSLWVDPAFRRQGWGAQLLRDAEDGLRQMGVGRSLLIPALPGGRYIEFLKEKRWELEEREVPNAESLERLFRRCGYELADGFKMSGGAMARYRNVFIKRL